MSHLASKRYRGPPGLHNSLESHSVVPSPTIWCVSGQLGKHVDGHGRTVLAFYFINYSNRLLGLFNVLHRIKYWLIGINLSFSKYDRMTYNVRNFMTWHHFKCDTIFKVHLVPVLGPCHVKESYYVLVVKRALCGRAVYKLSRFFAYIVNIQRQFIKLSRFFA